MHSKTLGRTAALALALAASACYKATFVGDPAYAKKPVTHTEWNDHFVFGIIGQEAHDVHEWCPEGAGMIRTGGSFATGLVTIATLGIYSPRVVYVTCATPAAVALEERR